MNSVERRTVELMEEAARTVLGAEEEDAPDRFAEMNALSLETLAAASTAVELTLRGRPAGTIYMTGFMVGWRAAELSRGAPDAPPAP